MIYSNSRRGPSPTVYLQRKAGLPINKFSPSLPNHSKAKKPKRPKEDYIGSNLPRFFTLPILLSLFFFKAFILLLSRLRASMVDGVASARSLPSLTMAAISAWEMVKDGLVKRSVSVGWKKWAMGIEKEPGSRRFRG